MKNISLSIIIFVAFSYGIIVGNKQIFPYNQIKFIKNTIWTTTNDKSELAFINPKNNPELAFINPKNNPDLPNVLIIGDSISIGYTQDVRKKLEGIADVYRIPENGRNTYYGLKKIKNWLGSEKWDIIHFNWGLWDIRYDNDPSLSPKRKISTKNEYKKQLEELVTTLEKSKAKLMWCATTPVPKGTGNRESGDEIEYNIIAEKIMNNHPVSINNLHKYAYNNLKDIQIPNNVHFTTQPLCTKST